MSRFSDFVRAATRGPRSRGWYAILDHAPAIMLVAVNALIAFGDWRLYQALLAVTGDALAAAAPVAVSAAGFVAWYDLALRYRYANDTQSRVAKLMTAVSLAVAGYGWYIAAVIEAGLGQAALLPFYRVITAATVGNVLAGLWWVAADDRLRMEREAARAEARARVRARHVRVTGALLETLRGVFDQYHALKREYGEDAVEDMMRALDAAGDGPPEPIATQHRAPAAVSSTPASAPTPRTQPMPPVAPPAAAPVSPGPNHDGAYPPE